MHYLIQVKTREGVPVITEGLLATESEVIVRYKILKTIDPTYTIDITKVETVETPMKVVSVAKTKMVWRFSTGPLFLVQCCCADGTYTNLGDFYQLDNAREYIRDLLNESPTNTYRILSSPHYYTLKEEPPEYTLVGEERLF